jgi:hypothetical protein
MSEKWHIQEGFYIEEISKPAQVLSLVLLSEESMITFCADEIEDIIDALDLARRYYLRLRKKESDSEELARWGTARTPTRIG